MCQFMGKKIHIKNKLQLKPKGVTEASSKLSPKNLINLKSIP